MTELPRKIAIFRVEVILPSDVSLAHMRRYILNALHAEKGALHPDDPLSGLENKNFHVGGGRVLIEGLAKKKDQRDEDPPLSSEETS